MKHGKIAFVIFVVLFNSTGYSQQFTWTPAEKEYYSKAKELCTFLKASPYDPSKRDFLFSNFIYFVNPRNDTTQGRLDYFDMLFYKFYRYADSVGFENLDVRPLRHFRKDCYFYKPFQEDLKWADSMCLVLTYYDKRKPDKPLGSLLFEPTTKKLMSWIILNMGGYLFLTPNMY